MAKSTPAGIVIKYDNSGGTLVDLSQYILTIGGVDVESVLEEVHSFGDSWEESLPIGVGKMAPIVLGGLYDSVVTVGPDALFIRTSPETPTSATRTLEITWEGSKKTTVETFVKVYKRSPDRNALTKFEVTLQPTGTVTEA